jgi:protein-S-isoprenylcysteine O-methyltransferase Ste14
MNDSRNPSGTVPKIGRSMWMRGILSLLLVLGTMGGFLFGSAGRLDWLAAWILVGGYGLFLVGFMLWGFIRNPDLIRERGRVAENVKIWDKWINAIYTLLLVALLVVSGLDAGRFGWATAPAVVQILGGVMVLGAAALIFWTLAENAYLSRWARIQDDRGQQVISSGPYAVVRHPMYAGIIVLMAGMPLALGSLWGLVPGGLIGILYLVRTQLEDRMLLNELEGYREYASRVRYRLIPGLW